jgi:hypothetical protein
MKNNKGYYSWIHSMKNAAMESHFKGQQQLNESSDAEIKKAIEADRTGRASSEAAKIAQLLKQSQELEARQRAEIMQGRLSRVPTGGESSRAEARAHASAMRKTQVRDVQPVDTNMNGIVSAADVVAHNKLDFADGSPDTHLPIPEAPATQSSSMDPHLVNASILEKTAHALRERAAGRHHTLSDEHKHLLAAHDQAHRDLSAEREAEEREDMRHLLTLRRVHCNGRKRASKDLKNFKELIRDQGNRFLGTIPILPIAI